VTASASVRLRDFGEEVESARPFGRSLNEAETRADGRKRRQEPPARYFSGHSAFLVIGEDKNVRDQENVPFRIFRSLRGLRPVNLSISSLLPGFSGQGGQEMGTNTEVALVELTDAEIESVAGGAKETEASTGTKG
jgi:hypothetical protein